MCVTTREGAAFHCLQHTHPGVSMPTDLREESISSFSATVVGRRDFALPRETHLLKRLALGDVMARNETHGVFADILAMARTEDKPICQSLRRLIALLDNSFFEVVWPKHKIASFGVGPKKMTQHY